MLLTWMRMGAAIVLASAMLTGCSLRLDDSRAGRAGRRSRLDAAAVQPEDRRLRPSYREMREARALAMAEAEIIGQGGNIRVTSSGASSRPGSVRYVHEPGALTMTIKADKKLNVLDDIPYALALTVYHLSDRAGVDRLCCSGEGKRVLMRGERFDESVVSVRTVYFQPGMETELVLDRPDRGRYVVLAAGYQDAHAEGAIYVGEYGLGQFVAAGETILHRGKTMFQPLPLVLDVKLGPESMAVYDDDRIYSFSEKAYRLTDRQVYQALYRRNRVAGNYLESSSTPSAW